ncbi:MAG: hypothetical protein HGA71_15530 [Azonexaceae bacterium]|nr:hypothetical protein [Azonexaceae bacterium]
MAKELLNVKDKRLADVIADLAIRFSAEAARHLPQADECELRVLMADALFRATMLPSIRDKAIAIDDNPLVARLFADGAPPPDIENDVWNLFSKQ